MGNLIELACKLLTVRQESYIKVATELTELASFQAASRAGAFEPEPEGRLMEQHHYVKSLPIPHVLLEHGSGRQGGVTCWWSGSNAYCRRGRDSSLDEDFASF